MASDVRNPVTRKKFLVAVRLPAFLIVINFFLVNTLLAFLPYGIGDIVYNAGRIAIICYSGWLVVRKKMGNVRHAALVGLFMYFLDHVILKGGIFLLNYAFKPAGPGLAAFSGVLVSFLLLAPIAMLVGAAGGLFARLKSQQSTEGPE